MQAVQPNDGVQKLYVSPGEWAKVSLASRPAFKRRQGMWYGGLRALRANDS